MIHSSFIHALAAGSLVAMLTGCGGDVSQSESGTVAEAPSLPILTEKPANPQLLSVVRAEAKEGDTVVFQARIGGRANALLENHAAAIVADTTVLESCDARLGDNCAIPWDFCCEPKEKITANTALIQFVDPATQKPYRQSLADLSDLKNGSFVIAKGTVASTEGSYVINLNGIYHDTERKVQPLAQ